jgi:hypothetical protein
MATRIGRAALAAAVISGGAFFTNMAPAHADETCQDIGGVANGCVATTDDPTTGSFGVRVSGGPLNLCLVVFAACPEPPAT